jgi:hypothetical protein
METMIPKNTLLTCRRKNHPIGVLSKPIQSGIPLALALINFESGQERRQGEPFRCTICDSLYSKDGMIHSHGQWIPEDPHLEPVKKKPKDFKPTKLKLKPPTKEEKQKKVLEKVRKDKKPKKKDK